MKAEFRTFLALAMVLSIAFVPMITEDSDASAYATCEGLNVSTFDDAVSMKAGGDTVINISLRNDAAGDITVRLGSSVPSGSMMGVDFSSNDFTLAKGKTVTVQATISCDRSTNHGTYSVGILFTVYNYSTATEGSSSITIVTTVTNEYASDSEFNKIFGIFDNNLPEPFNGPAASAIMTAIIWIAIAALAFAILYFITGRYFKFEDEDRRTVRKRTGIMLIVIILLHGLIETLKVYGANEDLIRIMYEITKFTDILMVAYIIWYVYKAVIRHIFHKMEKQDRLEGVDTSLIPLFNIIGEIIIWTCAAAGILSVLGINLAAILAGAGIVALAISIGAQGILTQFFGGVTLLITRPFKAGDVVRINGSSDFYEVQKIGILNTTFKNWESLDIITMPNNKVGSDNIVNATNDTTIYRLFLYYSVDFESDFNEVKRILINTASKHPDVIIDGSVSPPDVRVNNFYSTAVEVRLAVYIKDFNDRLRVTDELYISGLEDLQSNGVNIPYEKRDVHLVVKGEENTSE